MLVVHAPKGLPRVPKNPMGALRTDPRSVWTVRRVARGGIKIGRTAPRGGSGAKMAFLGSHGGFWLSLHYDHLAMQRINQIASDK